MKIYKVNGDYYQNKEVAENKMKDIAIKYWEQNPLDERDLESLECGGKQYVADRYLKKDMATIVSYCRVINVL